jgi:hypothetical protein
MSWENQARFILKSQIARKGHSYATLAVKMTAAGFPESKKSIANKMSRGRFSFIFYLQALRAMGIDEVTIEVPKHSPLDVILDDDED